MSVKCCGSCRHITGFTKYSGILWCILYEKYILASEKSSNKGQFFTPQTICDLLTYTCPTDKKIVYDPACGSGRMGLSYYQVNPTFKFIGEELRLWKLMKKAMLQRLFI